MYKSLDFTNLAQLKKSRFKIENDCQSLQNRVNLLHDEERRAQLNIEQTRAKAELIFKNKVDQRQFKETVERVRYQTFKSKREIVESRNETASEYGLSCGAIFRPAFATEEIKELKRQEA